MLHSKSFGCCPMKVDVFIKNTLTEENYVNC